MYFGCKIHIACFKRSLIILSWWTYTTRCIVLMSGACLTENQFKIRSDPPRFITKLQNFLLNEMKWDACKSLAPYHKYGNTKMPGLGTCTIEICKPETTFILMLHDTDLHRSPTLWTYNLFQNKPELKTRNAMQLAWHWRQLLDRVIKVPGIYCRYRCRKQSVSLLDRTMIFVDTSKYCRWPKAMETKSWDLSLQIRPAGSHYHPGKIPQFQPYQPVKDSHLPSVLVLSAKDNALTSII